MPASIDDETLDRTYMVEIKRVRLRSACTDVKYHVKSSGSLHSRHKAARLTPDSRRLLSTFRLGFPLSLRGTRVKFQPSLPIASANQIPDN